MLNYQVISELLLETQAIIFQNPKNEKSEYHIERLIICNTSAVAQTIYLSIGKEDDPFAKGAILFGFSIAANETIPVIDKALAPGYCLKAYASTSGVVSISGDVLIDNTKKIANIGMLPARSTGSSVSNEKDDRDKFIGAVDLELELTNLPSNVKSIMVFKNGAYLTPETDWTIDTKTITLAVARLETDEIIVHYKYLEL